MKNFRLYLTYNGSQKLTNDHLPILLVVAHLVADPELGKGGAAQNEADDAGYILLVGHGHLILVPSPVSTARVHKTFFFYTAHNTFGY